MAMFRSQTMSKIEVTFKDIEFAKQFIDDMGKLECIQFIDLQKNTSTLKKPFSRDLLKIKEILNRINVIQQIMDKYTVHSISISPSNEMKQDDDDEDEGKYKNDTNDNNNEFNLKYDDISSIYESLQKLERDKESISQELNKQNNISRALSTDMDLFVIKQKQKYRLQGYNKCFIGFVNNAKRVSFQREIYMISKPETIIQFKEDGKDENFFIVFYNDETLKNSYHRICKLMNIEICYDSNGNNKEQLLWSSIKKSEELKEDHKEIVHKLQQNVTENALKIEQWKHLLQKQKAIKSVLNMCLITTNMITINGWCSLINKDLIHQRFAEITMNQSDNGTLVFKDVSKYDATYTAPTTLQNNNDCVIL